MGASNKGAGATSLSETCSYKTARCFSLLHSQLQRLMRRPGCYDEPARLSHYKLKATQIRSSIIKSTSVLLARSQGSRVRQG